MVCAPWQILVSDLLLFALEPFRELDIRNLQQGRFYIFLNRVFRMLQIEECNFLKNNKFYN